MRRGQWRGRVGEGERRTERGRELSAHGLDDLLASHVVHQVQDNLDGRQDDGAVRVLKSNRYPFGEQLGVLLFLWHVVHKRLQDVRLTPPAQRQYGSAPCSASLREINPLRTLPHRRNKPTCHRRVQSQVNIVAPFADLRERSHSVRDDRRVRVCEQITQRVDESLLLDEAAVVHVELGDADGGRLANVRISVL